MNAKGYVTPEEVRVALRQLYRGDREINLQKALLHAFRDKLKPVTHEGHWKANPLLVILGLVALTLVSVLIFFSYGAKT